MQLQEPQQQSLLAGRFALNRIRISKIIGFAASC